MNKIQAPEVQEDNYRIAAHCSTLYGSVSLAKSCYIIMYDLSHKNGVKYQGGVSKKHRISNWYQKQYIFQEKEHVEHQDVKMTYNFEIFPELEYKVPHKETRVARGIGRH